MASVDRRQMNDSGLPSVITERRRVVGDDHGQTVIDRRFGYSFAGARPGQLIPVYFGNRYFGLHYFGQRFFGA